MMLVSFVTRPPDRTRIDQFYGKMKTPVGATPELELAAIQAALGRGWKPSQRGLPAFRVHDAEQVAPVGEPDAEPHS